VRNLDHREGLRRVGGSSVEGNSTMAEFTSNNEAARFGCCTKAFNSSDTVKKFQLIYPEGDSVTVVISKDRDACETGEPPWGRKKTRDGKQRIWV